MHSKPGCELVSRAHAVSENGTSQSSGSALKAMHPQHKLDRMNLLAWVSPRQCNLDQEAQRLIAHLPPGQNTFEGKYLVVALSIEFKRIVGFRT